MTTSLFEDGNYKFVGEIEKGDYTGVQRIIDSIKGQRGTSKPRYASQNPLPRRNVSSGSNAPKLSDIL